MKRKKITGLLVKVNFLAILFLLLFASSALSRPVGGIAYVENGTYGNSPGGEFAIHVTDTYNDEFDFIGFCLELNENIYPPETYKIESIENFATLGGVGGVIDFKDEMSAATKWVYWNYLFEDTFINDGFSKDELADEVQYAIWLLEDETGTDKFYDDIYVADSTFYQKYLKSYHWGTNGTDALGLDHADFAIAGDVYALNLVKWNPATEEYDHIQSLVVGNPVPEPATMLLFGTGLLGLAGFARRRNKK